MDQSLYLALGSGSPPDSTQETFLMQAVEFLKQSPAEIAPVVVLSRRQREAGGRTPCCGHLLVGGSGGERWDPAKMTFAVITTSTSSTVTTQFAAEMTAINTAAKDYSFRGNNCWSAVNGMLTKANLGVPVFVTSMAAGDHKPDGT